MISYKVIGPILGKMKAELIVLKASKALRAKEDPREVLKKIRLAFERANLSESEKYYLQISYVEPQNNILDRNFYLSRVPPIGQIAISVEDFLAELKTK